jgi:hypothetical protein
MSMLYSLPIDEIGFEHIQGFCEEDREESAILDYKADWPKNLEKTIAAMANTSGGIILVGVAERSGTRRPELPIAGVTVDAGVDGLKQKVTSTAYRAIYPPVFPEVRVCQFSDDSNRAVVLIRVHESAQTPHATHGRSRVHVRVDSQSEPEPLANLEQLQWLFDRRAKAEAHRRDLIEKALAREANDMRLLEATASRGTPDSATTTQERQRRPKLIVYTVPLFPERSITTTAQLIEHCRDSDKRQEGHIRDAKRFYPSHPSDVRPVPYGVRTRSRSSYHEIEALQYGEFNEFGLAFMLQRLDTFPYSSEQAALFARSPVSLPQVVLAYAIMAYIDAVLLYSADFYDEEKFRGLVRVFVGLQDVEGVHLKPKTASFSWASPALVSLDNEIDLLEEDLLAAEILPERKSLLERTFSRLIWGFGHSWSDEQIEKWINQNVEPIEID